MIVPAELSNWIGSMGFSFFRRDVPSSRLIHRIANRTLLPLVLTISCCAGAFAQVGALPAPWQQKAFKNAAYSDASERSLPRISNGYLLSFQRVIRNGPKSDTIVLDSLTSGRETQFPFWVSGASTIWLDEVAVTPGHRLLVAGSFSRPDGTIGNFIKVLTMAGKTLASIGMQTYEPEMVCTESDGTIWTLGQDWKAQTAGAPYSLLRNYTMGGHLLRSYLGIRDFPATDLNFSTRLKNTGGTPGRAFLRCGDKSVGAYIGPALIWTEVQLTDHTARTWMVRLSLRRTLITGLALVGDHSVYGSFKSMVPSKAGDPSKAVLVRGLYKLNLSRTSLTAPWEPVPGTTDTAAAQPSLWLAGSDGPSLVYERSNANSPDGSPILFWSKP
jgi:hypothetical protein